ncbi:TonB-dependent receptor [Aquimarina pacifica]|uniref:TonB-dependent receptor n=1 Tax=Aquimarina pacifica TaxID=1296415 RepID=UPI00046FCF84|nr:TonB-dependent receptor [Aquimarina pacifica]
MKTITLVLMLFLSVVSVAQTVITGKVLDDYDEPIPGVSVVVKGTTDGTISDFDGNFSLTTSKEYPITLESKSIGYDPVTTVVSSGETEVTIVMGEITFLDELVIAASRAPERIFESPVSIERLGINDIKESTSADFYGSIGNLKGVDINENSLALKTVNTRGFATMTNTRFVQLVDGMDNTAPALNFPLANLLGLSELDVRNIELLPGASSALYGANAFNGILFMNSKNPFDHTGISGYFKGGITSQEAAGDNEFYDYGVRVAHAFSDKFAAKANISYVRGSDWLAADEQDLDNPGLTRADPGYNGLNVYGDEAGDQLSNIGPALVAAGVISEAQAAFLPDTFVTRTGYAESDIIDNKVESLKFDVSLHYRPFASDLELIYTGKVGRGSVVTQDANRVQLSNFGLQQHMFEIKNDNFFLRGYLTAEKAGDSYNVGFTGLNLNNAWKSNGQWFGEYAGAYLGALGAGQGEEAAHAFARSIADTGRLEPGTPEFQAALDRVTNDSSLLTGSKFDDESKFRHVDANYNFSHITGEFADIQIGGSFREYELNSFGTLFTDGDGPITYNEYGLYTQIQKKLLDERLKLTGSIRYDESELFDGSFSPRFSVGYTLGSDRNQNIRASFQTGFRNPATQDLFIGLDVSAAVLVGSSPTNLDKVVTIRDYESANPLIGSGTFEVTPRAAYENAFSLNSVENGTFEASTSDIVQPERVTSYEVGYRGNFNNTWIVDASLYYNQYEDFISNETVIVPLYGQVSEIANGDQTALLALQENNFVALLASTNSDVDISSYGANFGVSTKVFNNFDFGVNYTYAKQDFDQEDDPDFNTNFNTPEHKVKASFGNNNLFENFGFNINARWSDAFFWEADFGDGEIPSYTVIDAQINYKIPSLKTSLKAGATNLGGDEYISAIGSGFIGSQYYIGLIINNL